MQFFGTPCIYIYKAIINGNLSIAEDLNCFEPDFYVEHLWETSFLNFLTLPNFGK